MRRAISTTNSANSDSGLEHSEQSSRSIGNRIRQEIRELHSKQDLLLKEISTVKECLFGLVASIDAVNNRLDQLENRLLPSGSALQHHDPPVAVELNPARTVDRPPNDTFKVYASDIRAFLSNYVCRDPSEVVFTYKELSNLAEEAIAEMEEAMGTPGECKHAWKDVKESVRRAGYDLLEQKAALVGICINRCPQQWAAVHLITERWRNRVKVTNCR